MESKEGKLLIEENIRLRRQLEIENALEEIRGKATDMRGSAELSETSAVLFHQLKELKIPVIRTGVGIFDDANDAMELWITAISEKKELVKILDYVNMHVHPVSENLIPARKEKKPYALTILKGKEIGKYYQIMSSYLSLPGQVISHEEEYFYSFFFSQGVLNIIAAQSLTEEECQVMIRFAKAFGLIYTRFLDLQRAEAQTREAQVEAALERVRSRAMGMHKSSELLDVIAVVSQELVNLGFKFDTVSFGINTDFYDFDFWIASGDMKAPSKVHVPYLDSPVFNRLKQARTEGKSFFSDSFTEEETRAWMQHVVAFGNFKPKTNEYLLSRTAFERSTVLLKHIFLFITNFDALPYSDSENELIIRFAKAFEQTYIRFLDLERAEANARDSMRQASLDRVRAEIASMRSVTDLDRITPLIWSELTTLGIPFVRCGVFIMDNVLQQMHTFLSTPDGKAIAAFHLPFDTPGRVGDIYQHWKKHENYIEHWDLHDYEEFADLLTSRGPFSKSQYMSTVPPQGIHLHCLPFLQGMFYVGNTTPMNADEVNLIHLVAEAFSTAYARYEDFNKLESAKQQVDNTLSDLKQAQTQLIQSEKMASLGELTAGIAHEIQNPLNFVNNFSEVSKELLDEMSAALDLGDVKNAKQLAKDVIDNLDKINHHGKRADSIVKGMLQHSRSSTNVKELTDINILADEYLRLCYHGLRAKDKSFSATIRTDFDKGVTKINVVPQDIGRVILNLLTNAFYAVSQKKEGMAGMPKEKSYEPMVSLCTKKVNNGVEILVTDNGKGIPQKVIDKIFQPFFTTKPTGQGTGLGLSLSYDIAKSHGGAISVQTIEGEGTTFTLQLPVG